MGAACAAALALTACEGANDEAMQDALDTCMERVGAFGECGDDRVMLDCIDCVLRCQDECRSTVPLCGPDFSCPGDDG